MKSAMAYLTTAAIAVVAVALLSRTQMGANILGVIPAPKAK